MSEPVIDIERIVREVLAELSIANSTGLASGTQPVATQSETNNSKPEVLNPPASPIVVCTANEPRPTNGRPGNGPNKSTGRAIHQANINKASVPGELVINSRVVTMEEIAGRLDARGGTGSASDTRRVLVARNAVVTPAVRDELIRRGITLGYSESSNENVATPIRLVMITTGTDFDPKALVAGLTREGLSVEHTASDCIIASTEQLAVELVRPNTLGLLLTRYTAPGLCLANRQGSVRAVMGVDAPAVAVAAASVGANMLVANPRAGTFFQLKQMVAEFCRGGVRDCPGVFRAQLA